MSMLLLFAAEQPAANVRDNSLEAFVADPLSVARTHGRRFVSPNKISRRLIANLIRNRAKCMSQIIKVAMAVYPDLDERFSSLLRDRSRVIDLRPALPISGEKD